MAETYQGGVLLTCKGHMIKTQKRPNAKPQGVPEALDRFFVKTIPFPIILVCLAETYQRGIFFTFEGHMIKTEKRSNTEPQGVPEALDRFFGKLIQFSTISKHRQWLKLTKEGRF